MVKLRSLSYVHFVVGILFALSLAFDRSVLYGNVVLSIVVLSTKKQDSRTTFLFFRKLV